MHSRYAWYDTLQRAWSSSCLAWGSTASHGWAVVICLTSSDTSRHTWGAGVCLMRAALQRSSGPTHTGLLGPRALHHGLTILPRDPPLTPPAVGIAQPLPNGTRSICRAAAQPIKLRVQRPRIVRHWPSVDRALCCCKRVLAPNPHLPHKPQQTDIGHNVLCWIHRCLAVQAHDSTCCAVMAGQIWQAPF